MLGVCSIQVHAQTLERYAGGATLQDVPGTSVPLWAQDAVVGPDGFVYVADVAFTHDRIVRFDPATSTATVMRTSSGQPLPAGSNGVALDPAGNLHIGNTNQIFRLDPVTGQQTPVLTVGGNWSNNPFLFDSNGRLFAANSWNSYIVMLAPWSAPVTFAGSPSNPGFNGDGGPAAYSWLNIPRGIATDAAGNLYIADTENNRIRKVEALTGIITTIAGNGQDGFSCIPEEDVPALETCIPYPYAVAVDVAGNLFIHVYGQHRIRKVDAATGLIRTVIGGNTPGIYGDGGPAIDAGYLIADRMSVDAAGNLYFPDDGRVRRIDAATGIIDTVIGNGTSGFCGEAAPRLESCLGSPRGLALDADGDLFISDSASLRVRRVSATTGELTTYAGHGFSYQHAGDGGLAVHASFGTDPADIALDSSGNLVIAGDYSHRVRRVDAASGIITTIAGTGQEGFTGDGGPASLALLRRPRGVAFAPNGDIYVADTGNHRVRRIDVATGNISTIAGNGLTTGALGDGGPATAASLYSPDGLAFDSAGNLLIVDSQHNRIRKVSPVTGIITTVAADLGWGARIALDAADNIFVGTYGSLRRIDAVSGVITSIPASCCLYTEDGLGIEYPTALAFDGDGNLYVADYNHDVVFRLEGVGAEPSLPDTTPPSITAQVSGTTGNDGWYRSDVQVSWDVNDAESAVSASSGCGTTTVSDDTAGITFTCTATSGGGAASSSVTIKRDATPPMLTFGTPSPTPGANGWYRTNVTIPFTRSDALAGVATTSVTSPLVISTEGVGVTGQVVVTDNAGNSATFASVPLNIDKTAPVVNIATPAAGATYGFYQDVIADYECVDVSPVSCVAPTADGEPLNTRTAGARTLTVTARDASSFTTSVTRAFTVETQFNFEGFLAPVSAPPTLNLVSRGALVPIRWRLPDGRGGFVTNPLSFMSAKVGSLTCGSAPSAPLNDTAIGPEGLSFDATSSTFTYNWQTNPNWTGCYVLTIKLRDNVPHPLHFRLQ